MSMVSHLSAAVKVYTDTHTCMLQCMLLNTCMYFNCVCMHANNLSSNTCLPSQEIMDGLLAIGIQVFETCRLFEINKDTSIGATNVVGKIHLLLTHLVYGILVATCTCACR